MRVLVISDIHANLSALETVIMDAGEVEAVWCLGDLVGYGPDPNGCVERIRALPNLTCIKGNHDAAVLKAIDTGTFNPEAHALVWTRNTLSPMNKVFLGSLQEKIVWQDVTLTHGSPRQPIWEYITDSYTAAQNFDCTIRDFAWSDTLAWNLYVHHDERFYISIDPRTKPNHNSR